MPRAQQLNAALRGAAAFGGGIAIACLPMSSGYIFIGVTVGAAFAGAALAWTTRNRDSILLAALGLDLGVWLGGLAISGSFGFFAYDQPNQEKVSDLLGFYCVFTSGFGVVGAGFAATTASRLVSRRTGISSFGIGGAIGGAVAVLSVMLPLTTGTTGTMMLLSVILSFLISGALCGESMNASGQTSLSILADNSSELGNRPLHWKAR